MKIAMLVLAGALVAGLCCGCQSLFDVRCRKPGVSTKQAAANMKRTYDFLKEAKVYYIATVDCNDQPHVRPFGTINIFEGKLYIQTGRKKHVARQLMANGKVELCAMKGPREVLRVTGTLVEDPRREAKAAMLDAYPGLKKMYSPDDANTMVLYFKPGTVRVTITDNPTTPTVDMMF